MVVTELGRFIDDNFLLPWNAALPMVVIEFPNVTFVKFVHWSKANISMVVTEFPIVTDVKSLQRSYLQMFLYQLLVC